MNRKSYNRMLAFCFALLSSSSCGAKDIRSTIIGSQKCVKAVKTSNGWKYVVVPSTLVLIGMGTAAAKYSGWGPFAPNSSVVPTPDIPPYVPGKPEPKGVLNPVMYQLYQKSLKSSCLKDYLVDYLNSGVKLEEAPKNSYHVHRLYLGLPGSVAAFEDLDTMKKKAFLGNNSTVEINSNLCGFNHLEEAAEAIQEWNRQNNNQDAGEKYNTLVNLIGLPINNRNDIVTLAKILRNANIVNEDECISIGVTSFNNRQNRICVAMYGDVENCKNYKKIVTSCQKGLRLEFDKSFYTCGTSNTEWGDETKRYYFITPTSITDLKNKEEIF